MWFYGSFMEFYGTYSYPLVNVSMTMERSTCLGKNRLFNGNFQQRTGILPEGMWADKYGTYGIRAAYLGICSQNRSLIFIDFVSNWLVQQCHKPPKFFMVNIPPIYGDEWGMVYGIAVPTTDLVGNWDTVDDSGCLCPDT